MFKAIMIIYVLEIAGKSAGGISVTPFETIAQCEQAKPMIEEVIKGWHYGDNEKDVVKVLKTAKCFPIQPGSPLSGSSNQIGGMMVPEKPAAPVDNSAFGSVTW